LLNPMSLLPTAETKRQETCRGQGQLVLLVKRDLGTKPWSWHNQPPVNRKLALLSSSSVRDKSCPKTRMDGGE
jgi:hypothetical protein